jgi:methionyl-tRNA formyltransferase
MNKDDKNYLDLRQELAECGARLVSDILPLWLEDKIEPQEQNHDLATYTKKLTKADGEIDLANDPILNYKKIRAFCDWPVAYFFIEKNSQNIRLKITQAHLDQETGELVLDKVIPEGKREMKWEDFKRGL